jgi:DedD protein
MEIKGEQFLKKAKIKQEKEELEEKLTELKQEEDQVYTNQEELIRDETPTSDNNHEFDLNVNQDSKVAYDNIMLDEEPTRNINPDKKRNYLILGLVLIILFLITILIFRMVMGDDEKNKDDGFTSTKIEEQINNQLASKVDSNFQKIMNEKKKREEEINQRRLEETRLQASELTEEQEETNPMSDKALNETINKVKEKEKAQLNETQRIIKTIEEKQVAPKPIVVKQEPKEEIQKIIQKPKATSVKELVNKVESSKPNGYFIQVGAFTKTPSQKYINTIKNANLKYIVHIVTIKGSTYNKVLVGPYSSRAQAKQDVENVKRKLKLSSAFVLKI